MLNTHGFVRDELVGEKLDWWMAVTCCDKGVFRMCMHELGKSRVDETCVCIDSVILDIVIARAFRYTFSEDEAIHYRSHTRR